MSSNRDKIGKQIETIAFQDSKNIRHNGKNIDNIWNQDNINIRHNGKNIYNIYRNIDTSEYCCAKCNRLVGCFDSFERTVCCGKKMCSNCEYCCAGCRQSICYKHAQQHNKKSKKCFEYMNDYLCARRLQH